MKSALMLATNCLLSGVSSPAAYQPALYVPTASSPIILRMPSSVLVVLPSTAALSPVSLNCFRHRSGLLPANPIYIEAQSRLICANHVKQPGASRGGRDRCTRHAPTGGQAAAGPRVASRHLERYP